MGPVKATKAKEEVFGEHEVESWELRDVDVGKPAVLADGGCGDAVGGGAEGGVGELVSLAVNALWDLVLVVWWKRAATGGWCWCFVGGSEQLLVFAFGSWWLVSSKSYCEIPLGKSLRGIM